MIIDVTSSKELNGTLVRESRDMKAICGLDCKSKYDREQESISKGISVIDPMAEADYILVLQYLQDLFELPSQSGFPWDGPDDPLCPWPIKPDCVMDSPLMT